MESTNSAPPASSTVTLSSSISYQPPPTASRLLEITLISAQDLFPVSKSMRPFAVTWVQPNRKKTTCVDQKGHANPTWNDKFAFLVDDELLSSENSAVNVEIYSVSWFRSVIVGTVRVLISNLITTEQYQSGNMRYVALQIRRPSGGPQGILNMGVSLVDSTMRSMPALEKTEINDEEIKQQLNPKVHLWRSLSHGSSEVNNEEFPGNPGSVCNASMVNGSELCSDVGPSASIVAAEIAQKSKPQAAALKTKADASESCILEELTAEEAAAKGLTTNAGRWRKDAGWKSDEDGDGDRSSIKRLPRRRSGGGLCSCFGNAYGFEFTIVCGDNDNGSTKPVDSKSKKNRPSEANSA